MQIIDIRIKARLCAITQRVLIVDAQPAAARSVSDRLRDVCPCQIWTAAEATEGMDLAARIDPRVIFVGQSPALDGAAFVRALRRSELGCRQAPVILISPEPTAAAIVAARDAGAHEFLRKPFTAEDLARHLEAVAGRPRDWVEGVGYVGPDRRRFNSGDYSDVLKRRVEHAVTSDDARIVQALKILEAAMLALEADPHQAQRAMRAQAVEIAAVAKAHGDDGLWAAATTLGHKLAALASPPSKSDIAPLIGSLLAQLGGAATAAGRRSAA